MKRMLFILLVLLLLIAGAGVLYLNIYEHPTEEALAAAQSMQSDDSSLWIPGRTTRGYLLYPGGKVDERAYAPFAQMLSQGGDTVAIARMPFRLAILDPNRASEIMRAHPEVKDWVLIGHSLGGTAASMFAAEHPEQLLGLCFLASYPYRDLSEAGLWCLSFLGAEDGVLDLGKYAEAQPYFPSGTKEILIPDGNHSNFGSYGLQRGDTAVSLSAEAQQSLVAEGILSFVSAKHP